MSNKIFVLSLVFIALCSCEKESPSLIITESNFNIIQYPDYARVTWSYSVFNCSPDLMVVTQWGDGQLSQSSNQFGQLVHAYKKSGIYLARIVATSSNETASVEKEITIQIE